MKHEILSKNYDIIILTETWLNSSTNDSELNLRNYNIHRKDREDAVGGGVLVAIRSTLSSTRLSICSSMEAILINIKLKNEQFHLLAVYRSPNVKYQPTNFIRKLERIVKKYVKTIYIIGDLNLPKINWNDTSQSAGQCETSTSLLDIIVKYDLKQHVSEPTHMSTSILDLVIAPNNIHLNVYVNEPFSRSDHKSIVIIKGYLSSKKRRLLEKRLNFAKTDWDGIKETIRSTVFNTTTCIDTLYTDFCEKMNRMLERFTPFFNVNFHVNAIPKSIRQQLAKRRNLYDCWKRCQPGFQKEILKKKYTDEAKRVSHDIKLFEQQRITKIIKDSTSNPKVLYNYCSKILSKNDSNLCFSPRTDREAAELLAEKFLSDFSEPSPYEAYRHHEPQSVRQPYISMREVKNAINKSKSKHSHGADGIPSSVLKMCMQELSPILTRIFNQSLTQQKVPQIWRSVTITPLHKQGLRNDLHNYRPISVPSSISKLMETIIENRIRRQLEPQHHLFKNQHGFMKNKNSSTNLLLTYGDIFETKNNGKHVDIIFIDFA